MIYKDTFVTRMSNYRDTVKINNRIKQIKWKCTIIVWCNNEGAWKLLELGM